MKTSYILSLSSSLISSLLKNTGLAEDRAVFCVIRSESLIYIRTQPWCSRYINREKERWRECLKSRERQRNTVYEETETDKVNRTVQ